MFGRREIHTALTAGFALITVGSAWLWGPVPLLVLGGLLIAIAFAIEY